MNDSSSINIEINVVDGSGSISTINATTAAVEGLGTAGTKAGTQISQGTSKIKSDVSSVGTGVSELRGDFNDAGSAGVTMAGQVSTGMQQISGHTMTSLDNVRLLRDDFGIHIPRGMEMAIARSAVLSSAIAGLGTGLVALGAIEIGARLAMGLYDAYEKYISLNAAAEEYAKTVQKNKDADFTNTHSIEETTARLREATDAARDFKTQADAIHNQSLFELNPVKAIGDLLLAHDLAADSVTKQAQAAGLTQKQMSDQHEVNDLLIQQQHAQDGSLQGQQKINAELAKARQEHSEAARYQKEQDSALQPGARTDGGRQQQLLQDQIAEGQAAAQQTELARQVRDKTIAMQDEARNAGLQGNALYVAQEQEAIATVERSATGSAGQIAAVREKFHNMELQRLQAETDEVNKRARAEQESGLTGLALIQARGQDAQNDIQQKQDRGGYASAADADKDRQTAHDATLRELGDAEKTFNEQIASLSEQSSNRMLTGFAKIDATRDTAIEKLAADWQKMYSDMDQTSAQFAAGQAMLDQGVAAISADADRERAQSHAKTMADIMETEVSAARTMQTEDRAATGAIVDDYNRRLAQAQLTLQQQLASNKLSAEEQAQVWQEYYARIKADADLAGAQMERAAQQTRDRLADSLGDLFSDPAGFLEKRAKDTMNKVLANALLSATNNLQSQGGQALAQILGLGPDLAAPTGNGGGFGAAFGLGKQQTGTGVAPLNSAAQSLTTAGSQLATSSSSLGTAGTTLSSSGTQLAAAASALQTAATSLASSRATGSGGGLGSLLGSGSSSDDGGGDFGGLGGADDFAGSTLDGDLGTLYSSASGGFAPGSLASSGTSGLESGIASAGSSAQSNVAALGSSTSGKALGIAGGVVTGGIALYNAFEKSDPLGGALGGAAAGASIGGVFGPEGMLIGAGIGAVAGAISGFLGELFGDNGRGKARDYDTGTVAPAIASELHNFNTGQTGYTQATRDLQNILAQAQSATSSMGSGARKYFTESISPEIATAQAKLDQEEQGGRGKLQMSAAQFHTGGLITGFGDFSTSGNEGFIHALMGERVMNPSASAAHGPMLDAMNAGHVFTPGLTSQMRGAISSITAGSTTRMGSGGGSPMSVSLSAIDAPSFARALRNGLGLEIQKHLTGAPGDYGGKANG